MKGPKSWKKVMPTKKNKHGADSLEGMLALKDLTAGTKKEIEAELNRRAKRRAKKA